MQTLIKETKKLIMVDEEFVEELERKLLIVRNNSMTNGVRKAETDMDAAFSSATCHGSVGNKSKLKNAKRNRFVAIVAVAASCIFLFGFGSILYLVLDFGNDTGKNILYEPFAPYNVLDSHFYQNAIALAAIQTIDAQNKEPTTNNTSERKILPMVNTALSVSSDSDIQYQRNIQHQKNVFRYTGIRIDRVFEFYVAPKQGANDFLTENCGDGELRVLVADFTFLIGRNVITDGIERPAWAPGTEVIVVVIGEKGMYHCLCNGSRNVDGGYTIEWEFSSDKYLNGFDLIKDSSSGFNRICVNQTGESFAFQTKTGDVSTQNEHTIDYTCMDETYAICDKAVLYDFTDVCLPFIDITVLSYPENYMRPEFNKEFEVVSRSLSKRFLATYTSMDENGVEVENEIFIVFSLDTGFDGLYFENLFPQYNDRQFSDISYNNLVSPGMTFRIEFLDMYKVDDTLELFTYKIVIN